jgi:hypothetical protein
MAARVSGCTDQNDPLTLNPIRVEIDMCPYSQALGLSVESMHGRGFMSLTDMDVRRAAMRMQTRRKELLHAISARFDRRGGRIVVGLSNGLDLGIPVSLAQGLVGAKATDLAKIEISPTGLGLHWPRLDADLYLPALLEGVFGTRRWMAEALGKAGGQSTSVVKRKASRANGKLGGRPRKVAHA